MSGEKDKAYDEGIEALKLALGVLSMPVEPTKEQRAEIKRILTRAAKRLADTRGLGLIEVRKKEAKGGSDDRVHINIACPKCGAEWGPSPSSDVPRPTSASLDHSTTGSLEHILQGICSCNAGGEVISGQELVIESIDVD